MRPPKYLQNVLVGGAALLFAGAQFVPHQQESGPVLTAAVDFVKPKPVTTTADIKEGATSVAAVTKAALDAFTGAVRPLSRPQALESAFRSYFAYKTSHPD